MSSTTPNIGLVLPVGSERVSRQIINENNTKIDTAIGTLNSNLNRFLDNNRAWLDSADINTLKSTGYYACKNNCANLPGTLWGYLSVIGLRSDTVTQTYTSLDNRMFVRKYSSGSWDSWEELATKSYVDKDIMKLEIAARTASTKLHMSAYSSAIIMGYVGNIGGVAILVLRTSASVTVKDMATLNNWSSSIFKIQYDSSLSDVIIDMSENSQGARLKVINSTN